PLLPIGPDGRRRNGRQEQERKKQRKNRRVKKLAAIERWKKERRKIDAHASPQDARALHMECLALAFALPSSDPDQKEQQSSATLARRALPSPGESHTSPMLRAHLSLFEVRPHLLAATYRLIDSGAPYVDGHGQPVESELIEELKRIATHDLRAEWNHSREL